MTLCLASNALIAQAQDFKFLEVNVVDPAGKPLADVPVEITIDNTSFPLPTDGAGKVGINVPAADNTEVEIRVKQEGYAAMAVGWRGGNKIPPAVTIPLSKGVTFGGVVQDEQGRPVEGVRVSGAMVFGKRHGLVHDGKVSPYLGGELAKTDKNGKWLCAMGPEGEAEFHLSFTSPGFLDHNPGAVANWQDLKNQQRVDVLDRGVSLTGQVLLPDGRPLPQTMVQFTRLERGGTSMWHEIANAEGKFRFARIPKGPAILSVQTAKYAPLKMPIDVQADIEDFSPRLENGKQIRIKLVDQDGDPVAGGRVEIVDWRFYRDNLELGKKSEADDQGVWSWNLVPSGELTFQVSAPGYRTAKHRLRASGETHTITLNPPLKVAGRVIDKATGEPIKKFRLVGYCIKETPQKLRYVEAFGSVERITNGEYEFQSVALCDECRVSCSAEGYKSVDSRAIMTDEDEVTWDFELERETDSTKED